ncbi:ATP-binding protein [Lactiplantibacillus dongliensis]|uniref:ATP-binding protein n=1 Tax=Lactiplantibacillus dongliensis TaxID=2559919 RepID=A0ABW1R1G3_9LACO|nr:ATP-binding protein [Lactiplantibacillus dongliensis]
MKLLRVVVDGLDMFSKSFDLNLITTQRVTENNEDSTTKLFNRIYLNNIIALIGKNASGKTMALNLFEFADRVFLQNEPLNHIKSRYTLIGDHFTFKTYYYEETEKILYEVISTIKKGHDTKQTLSFTKEQISSKKITQQTNRTNIFVFSSNNCLNIATRPDNLLLPDDNTYFRTITKQKNDQLSIPKITNFSSQDRDDSLILSEILSDKRGYQLQNKIIAYLDPTIDYIRALNAADDPTHSELFEIKFKNKTESTIINHKELPLTLSSGTIKGLKLFLSAFGVLASGGIFIVDEIEKHFHLAIVQTIMTLFANPEFNRQRATLIFTTHNAQLLNLFDRSDNIFISIRKNGLMALIRFSNEVSRNDLKKSDIYESDFLGGTAPSYEAYDALTELMLSLINVSNEDYNDAV